MAAVLLFVGAALLALGAGLTATLLGTLPAVGVGLAVAGVLSMVFGLDLSRDVPLEREAEASGT